MRSTRLALIAAGMGLTLAVSACGANSDNSNSGSGSGSSDTASSSGGGIPVGVILPETASSARWEGFDKPMLKAALEAEGLNPHIENAQGDVQKFSTLADGMINDGVKVLIIASINSEIGGTVAQKANAQGIPTIDYDRLNLGGSSSFYVSFDNVKVGELQGQGMIDALKDKPKGSQIIEIEGAPTDNNATLFHNGQENKLKPLYENGTFKLVQSQPIDNWDNQKGGTTFEQIFTSNNSRVDGVVAANDGLAGAIITVLKKYQLNGKVPVTGQDATADGLKAILTGDQYMTVFKPIKQEAEATAKLAAALAKGSAGKADADKIATDKENDPVGKRDVPSVLLEPKLITKNEVKQVIDQGYVKAEEVCTGELQSVCTQLGIS
ncbi:sugar ABC transporter substrate-binding protein [Actinophytocola sp.]|uniref:sugar ABC transporter substrate-binding protein n=1 Tax=Actinophytocola sp. TaxID=1872138 RepID=UPI00389A4821